MRPPRIETKRFTIRPYRRSDLSALVDNINDRRIARGTFVPHPYTIRDGHQWIEGALESYRKADRMTCKSTIEIEGEAAGGIAFRIFGGFKAEAGYWLATKHHGKGYMTQALKLMTRYAFNELGLRRVYAFTMIWNRASQRVLEKSGFTREGLLRKHLQHGRVCHDLIVYGRVK